MMSIGIFTDKHNQPSEAQVLETIGSKIQLWNQLISTVRQQYPVEEDFKFLYGKNNGWAARFRIKGQLLVSLFSAQDRFVAQINLGPEDIEKVLPRKMSVNIQQAIERANPDPEGRWLFIPVETEEDLRDVQQLIEIHAQTKRLI